MTTESNIEVKPRVVVFDVNETLSDLAPLVDRLIDIGVGPGDATAWFPGLLRDGFALTSMGENPDFAEIAAGSLRILFAGISPTTDVEEAIDEVMGAFSELTTHPDVAPGLEAIAATGVTMITLSNGSAGIARQLLDRPGLADLFEDMLSVADAERWKPAPEAYRYPLAKCDVEPAASLMVAVHPWDLAGAAAVGMQTAWINRTGLPYPRYFPSPTWTGTSLLDLADELSRLFNLEP
jgi:2-haloacid dehalogenase